MKKNVIAPVLLFLLAVFPNIIKAQDGKYTLSEDSLVNYYASLKRVYYATRIISPPKIDGKLIDDCWEKQGLWSGGFRQQQPLQAQLPTQDTEIKILYDDNNLYVGIRCFDSEPEKIRPILGRRDDYTSGDIAGIAIDSYNDKRTAFEFNVTAAGQRIDMIHLGAYKWDYNWDAVWDGKAFLEDSAWTAEMRIPFSQLRYADKEEQVWGLHIWRWLDRLDEEDQWKLVPVDAPAMVYIFGELRGIKNIKSKRNIEFLPYGKAGYGNTARDKYKYGFGLDGKIGVTSDFTLDYTINPDFGQVEADPSVLNLTSYEIFYSEKRPFFLEGNSILNYRSGGDLLFYSRRVGHAPSDYPSINKENGESLSIPDNTTILSALKLTGKSKKGLSLGIINSMTSKEEATIYSGNTKTNSTVEPFTNYFIGRVKQDINKGNTVIGGMLTSTIRSIKTDNLNFLPERALVGGFDLQHNWKNRKYFFNLKSFFSDVKGSTEAIDRLQRSSRHYYQRPDAAHLKYDPARTSLSGWGGEFSGGKRSGKFRAIGALTWRSPGVDLNDLGYLRQADFVKQKISLRYQVNEPNGIIRNYFLTLRQAHSWSYGGENTGNKFGLHAYIKFNNLWKINFNLARNSNVLDTRQLRGGPALRMDDKGSFEFNIQTNSARNLFLGALYNTDWYSDKISGSNNFSVFVRWQISNRLTLTSRTYYDKTIFNSQFVYHPRWNTTNPMYYIVGKIDQKTLYTTLRMEYFLTPEFSLQYYGSPYASTGRYLDLKQVKSPHAVRLGDRFTPLAITERVVSNANNYLLLDNNNDQIADLQLFDPDFVFQEFRSNFVARWEYKPGSILYLVWTHTRTDLKYGQYDSIDNSFRGIFNLKPQNIFMLKFSYWFSL
ncbi:FIG00652814: hypothetical protein [hydrothermal vent metagenome]|uniref:Uncharacterized protein n=1 Tax=hydrothermal vent metagenome TaxID=652676 RepID=A0A3B0TUB3_9ZZZZ